MSHQEKVELRHRAEQEIAAFGREHPRAARRMEKEVEVESIEAEQEELQAQSKMEQRDRERLRQLRAAEQRNRRVRQRKEQEVHQILASPNGREFCAATPSEIRQFGDRNAIRMYKQYCGKE